MTFLAGSWSDSPTGSRLQLGLSIRISISFRVRFPHGYFHIYNWIFVTKNLVLSYVHWQYFVLTNFSMETLFPFQVKVFFQSRPRIFPVTILGPMGPESIYSNENTYFLFQIIFRTTFSIETCICVVLDLGVYLPS